MFCLPQPEKFVPQDHPLWAIKPYVDKALPRLPPKRLLKARLLQAFYTREGLSLRTPLSLTGKEGGGLLLSPVSQSPPAWPDDVLHIG